jgi:hypothetical protein
MKTSVQMSIWLFGILLLILLEKYTLAFCLLRSLPPGKKQQQQQKTCQVPVAHACNSSYSGGSDQEDHSPKPARENSSQDPTSK